MKHLFLKTIRTLLLLIPIGLNSTSITQDATETVTLRPASKDDIPELVHLMEDLGYPCTVENFEQRFDTFLKNDSHGVATASIENMIVGLIAWSTTPMFILDQTRVHIEALVVAKQHRGKKIGKKLVEYVEHYAQQFSPAIVDLTSGLHRKKDGTHAFYTSLGYGNEGPDAKVYLRKNI